MSKISKILTMVLCLVMMLTGCIATAPSKDNKAKKKIVYLEEDEVINYYYTDNNTTNSSSKNDANTNTQDNNSSLNSENNSEQENEEYKPISSGEWEQDRFYLAAAIGPTTIDGIKAYKEVGYNLTGFGFMHSDEQLLAGTRNLSEVGGVYLIVKNSFKFTGGKVPVNEKSIRSVVYDYAELDTGRWIIGYDIWDEPILNEDFFTKSERMVTYFNKYDPKTLKFFNLLPSYGIYTWSDNDVDSAFGETGYEAYVEEFLQKIKPQVLSLDYYPYLMNQAGETGDWFRDMGLFRKMSLKYDTPFWYYYQLTSINTEPKPTNDEVRYQMYVGLAYGAKCLYGWVYDATDEDGNKNDNFEETKKRNAEIMPLGEYLLDKTTTEIYHTGTAADAIHRKNFYLDDLSESSLIASAPDGLIMSVFKDDKTNNTYLLVVNKDTDNGVTGNINLKTNKNISKFNVKTSNEEYIQEGNTISFNINAGGGQLFILK